MRQRVRDSKIVWFFSKHHLWIFWFSTVNFSSDFKLFKSFSCCIKNYREKETETCVKCIVTVYASSHVNESTIRIVNVVEPLRTDTLCILLTAERDEMRSEVRSCRTTRRTGCCDCSDLWWATDCRARRGDCCRVPAAAACSSAGRRERRRRPPGTPCPATRTPEPCGTRTDRTERHRSRRSRDLKETARYLILK